MLRSCSACGAPLPAELRETFCPVCTLHAALQLEDSAHVGAAPHELIRRIEDYELLSEIARGGVGVVYRARQSRLGRDVALKLLLAGHFADAKSRQRFFTEAAAAAQLRHPNIVEIYQVGEHEGQPFLAMELMEGGTLADCVCDGPIPARDAASLLAKTARAVEFAHANNILHRDLKPSNVMLDQFGEPRITDFGLAKHLGSNSDLTLTGQVLGSPSFMAPEQARGENDRIGPVTDVYSLGAILYQLITGRPPFQGDSAAAVLAQVERVEPVSPSRLNPGVPRDLENITLKCLEKSPSHRYGSARALAEDLQRFLDGQPVLARPLGWPARAWRWSQRHPGGATAISLLIALTIGSTFAAWRIQRAEHVATANLRVAEDVGYVRDLALADRAIEDGELALTRDLLEKHIPKNNERDLRTFEWGVLWRMSADQSQAVLRGHQHVVSSITFIGQRNLLASGSWDETVRIWDHDQLGPNGASELPAPTASIVLTNYSGRIWSVDASRDGTMLLAAGEGGAMIWETTHWHVRQKVGGGFSYASARFFPDGERVMIAFRNGNTIWDLKSNRLLPGLEKVASPIAFSTDGNLLASRSGNLVRIWELPRLTLQREIGTGNLVSFGLRDLAFSPDSQRLGIGSTDGRIALIDLSTDSSTNLTELLIPNSPRFPHLGWIGEVSFSPAGTVLVSAGADHQAISWSARRRVPVRHFRGHEHEVWATTFSPDGQWLATAGKDETVRLWKTTQPAERRRFTNVPEALGVWSDHELLVRLASTNDPVRRLGIYNFDTAKVEREIILTNLPRAISVFFQPASGDIAFRTEDGYVELWQLREDPPRRRLSLQLEPEASVALCISREGELFSTYLRDGHKSTVWNVNDGTKRFEVANSGGVVALNRDYVVSQPTWETPRVYDARSGRMLADLTGHKEQVAQIVFLPDRRTIVTAAWDGSIRFWEMPSGRSLAVSRSQRQGLYALTLSPDGRTLAAGGQDGVVRFWNVATRQETIRMIERQPISQLWFTPDGNTLVEQTADSIRLVRGPEARIDPNSAP